MSSQDVQKCDREPWRIVPSEVLTSQKVPCISSWKRLKEFSIRHTTMKLQNTKGRRQRKNENKDSSPLKNGNGEQLTSQQCQWNTGNNNKLKLPKKKITIKL